MVLIHTSYVISFFRLVLFLFYKCIHTLSTESVSTNLKGCSYGVSELYDYLERSEVLPPPDRSSHVL